MTGQELRRFRIQHHLTQKSLGVKLGFKSDVTILRYEQGRAPIPQHVEERIRLWMERGDFDVKVEQPAQGQ